MLWWIFIFLINVDLRLYCSCSAENDSSATFFWILQPMGKLLRTQCPIRDFDVHTALQSTLLLYPMPCDAPLYDSSQGEVCVCVCVCERERNVCLWFMCVCELWGKAELYI